MPTADGLHQLIADRHPLGLNVTIPYKRDVIPMMDRMDETAAEVGAVNTIKFFLPVRWLCQVDGIQYGCHRLFQFAQTLLKPWHTDALVLGTGGASMAVAYVLGKLGIRFRYVSRSGKHGGLTYDQLSPQVMEQHLLIVNCSPVGTFPNVNAAPDIPYQMLTPRHLLFDLVYNPELTLFCKRDRNGGCHPQWAGNALWAGHRLVGDMEQKNVFLIFP